MVGEGAVTTVGVDGGHTRRHRKGHSPQSSSSSSSKGKTTEGIVDAPTALCHSRAFEPTATLDVPIGPIDQPSNGPDHLDRHDVPPFSRSPHGEASIVHRRGQKFPDERAAGKGDKAKLQLMGESDEQRHRQDENRENHEDELSKSSPEY